MLWPLRQCMWMSRCHVLICCHCIRMKQIGLLNTLEIVQLHLSVFRIQTMWRLCKLGFSLSSCMSVCVCVLALSFFLIHSQQASTPSMAFLLRNSAGHEEREGERQREWETHVRRISGRAALTLFLILFFSLPWNTHPNGVSWLGLTGYIRLS